MSEPPPHLAVVDALGLCALARRSPTLDGSVALRATQGCSPLLEGNAFGLQVVLARAWRLRRSLGLWRAEPVAAHDTTSGWGLPLPASPDAPHAALDKRLRAAAETLATRGWIPRSGHFARALSRGVVSVETSLRAPVVRVATGLLVRPARGLVARVSRCANRGSLAYDVAETLYPDDEAFTPIVLELRPADGVDEFVLEGEVATLCALPRGVTIERARLEDHPAPAQTHLDFYDRTYFEQKRRGEVTRKYRRAFTASPAAEDSWSIGGPRPTVVDAGTGSFDTERSCRVATPGGVSEAPSPCASVTFRNEVAFTARFDGHRVWLAWDRAALDARARRVEARWHAALPATATPEGRGALWYLTKYFTPHPPGEPHFFTKPAALVVTPGGWSSVVEGAVGDGYEVMRGVVRTDRFHATPAVFALRTTSEVRVAEGAPLARVLPVPRALAAPRFAMRSLDEALP